MSEYETAATKSVPVSQKNVHLSPLSRYMNKKAEDLDDDSIQKLVQSSCINLINREDRATFAELIPEATYYSILRERIKKKKVFTDSLNESTAAMINALFDKLKVFQFDKEVNKIIDFIDQEKAKQKDKKSDEYNLLSVIDIAIKNFPSYEREAKLSKSSHLRLFQQLLAPVFIKTDIISKDENTVCTAIQRMQIIHDAEIADGKHKDLLLASNIKEANEGEIEDIELCSIGFKKTNERESALRRQQHKNIRTNACILNHIGLLVEDPTLPITYLDFSGRSAYIVQLFRYQDCFVSHKIGDFGMMKSLLELDLFRRYILNLYTWKQCVVNTNNTVLLAHLNQVSQYSMIDVSDDRDIESVSSPKYTVKSIKVILSPSKGSKRKRSVFEK